MSLTSRVSLSAALVLTVFVALTALALDRAFHDSARAAMRQRLFAQLYLVMAAAEVDAQGRLTMPETLGEPRLGLPGSGLYARIRAADGRVLWSSPSAVGLRLDLPTLEKAGVEAFARRPIGGSDYFTAGLRVDWDTGAGSIPLTFDVAENLDTFDRELAQYRRSLWGWLGAMAVLLLAALAAALAWGLRPLRTVAGELKAIETGGQPGLHKEYPRELRRLTDNINTLLRHERAQQARYKDALADLAHSLKTPLAVLRGLGSAQGPAAEQARTLEEQVARMDGIVQYQLQRAATAGRSALAAPLPVGPTVERLLASLEKVYRDKAVRVERALEPDAVFRGDEGDLMELLGNLLDNAYKWCRTTVQVGARRDGGGLLLTVEDDGPGISGGQAEAILKRGVRLDEATPGHGIGLAVAQDIAAAYESRLEFGRSALGGAEIRIRLPAG